MKLSTLDSKRIYIEGKKLYTRSETARSVYGEVTKKISGSFYRYWNPKRSKLSAAFIKGLKFFPFSETSNVLYLGASTGTTVSHLSDICTLGKIYAVELSYEPFTKLLSLAENRTNIYPILEDANLVERYSFFLENVDIIYQDISQRNQIQIFNNNADVFREARKALLVIKIRAISSRQNEEEILNKAISEIDDFRVIQKVNLVPYDKANYMLYLERK